jgi:hypothetical protein
MYSSRKESVRRHINNENIHMGNGTIISYSDSLIARQAGLYVSNPAVPGIYNGQKSPLPNSPKKMVEMFEKGFMQKMAEKMAEKTVNTTTLEPRTQPSYNNNIVSTENWLNYFFRNIENLFGIEGYICPSCLMIQPVKLTRKLKIVEDIAPVFHYLVLPYVSMYQNQL